MKVKIEIEMPEEQFYAFSESMKGKNPTQIDLGKLFTGVKAHIRELSRNVEPYYGAGAEPVGFKRAEHKLDLFVVDSELSLLN